jgi:alkylated DNA repair dioxygenase AlkB
VRRTTPPEGFRYRTDFLEVDEERDLIERFQDLPFEPFQFRGYLARRRVVAYGFSYDYGERALHPAPEMPEFLLGVRERAAAFAELSPRDLVQAVVAEYSPGTPIGWHRDRPVFGEVTGISLRSACVFRFRRKIQGGWERFSLTAEPRSIYLMRGPARTDWEHSIPEVPELRYSITFRTLRGDRAARLDGKPLATTHI